jgi:hypothetical protein
MSYAATIPSSRELTDQSSEELEARHVKAAERIAGRALTKIKQGQLSVIVRGGRLGLLNTLADPEVYPLVAERLLEERMEIAVHGITQMAAVDRVAVPKVVAHVISVETMKDWPTTYNPLHPVKHPGVLVSSLMGAQEIEQLYPLPSPVA